MWEVWDGVGESVAEGVGGLMAMPARDAASKWPIRASSRESLLVILDWEVLKTSKNCWKSVGARTDEEEAMPTGAEVIEGVGSVGDMLPRNPECAEVLPPVGGGVR